MSKPVHLSRIHLLRPHACYLLIPSLAFSTFSSHFLHLQSTIGRLAQRLIPAVVPLLAFREEVVDDDSDDWEDEDEQGPEDLVERWALRLEEFDWDTGLARSRDRTEHCGCRL